MASDPTKLVEFIASAKARNVADEFIASILRQNGWSDRRIFQAFSNYYHDVLGMEVPSRGSRLENARDAFYYLLTFISLGLWTVSLVQFAYAYIDHVLPSSLDWDYAAVSFSSQVAGQLATLIIAFPLFLFMSRVVAKETARRPEAFESAVRKWLTYIALVITAVTLLTDAVWFLSSYLSGELTARFAWQATVLFIVATGIFSFYLGTVRAESIDTRRDWFFASAATAAVAVALVLGFTSIGSPAQQRVASLDDQRITRLSAIGNAIHTRWVDAGAHGNSALPVSLTSMTELDADTIRDPDTHRLFRYLPTRGSQYQLCANFDGTSPPTRYIDFWYHSSGQHCFTFDARGSAPSADGIPWQVINR